MRKSIQCTSIQQADIVDVKFFVNFFAVREWNDRQTVDESNSNTTYLHCNSNETSKYLRCDFVE